MRKINVSVYLESFPLLMLRTLSACTGVPVAEYIRQGVNQAIVNNYDILEEENKFTVASFKLWLKEKTNE